VSTSITIPLSQDQNVASPSATTPDVPSNTVTQTQTLNGTQTTVNFQNGTSISSPNPNVINIPNPNDPTVTGNTLNPNGGTITVTPPPATTPPADTTLATPPPLADYTSALNDIDQTDANPSEASVDTLDAVENLVEKNESAVFAGTDLKASDYYNSLVYRAATNVVTVGNRTGETETDNYQEAFNLLPTLNSPTQLDTYARANAAVYNYMYGKQ